jgi:hypothetical protein
MKYPVGFLAALAALLAAPEAFAQDGMITAKARRWKAEISGNVKADDTGSSGSSIDVESTFGFDQEEDFDEFHITMGLPVIGRFNLQILEGGFDGTRTVSNSFTYAGTTYTASSQISTELDFKVYTLLWQFGASSPGVIGADMGAGIIAGLKYFQIDAAVQETSGANREETELNAPIPVFGAYFRMNLAKFLALEVQAHGLKVPSSIGQEVTGLLYDGTIALDAKIGPLFGGVGYRLFHFEVEGDDGSVEASADLDMKGIFFEVGVSF